MPEDLAPPDETGVWPDNEAAVEAFLRVQTQWRTVSGLEGMRFLGLDYAACRQGLEMAGIDVTPDLWAEVQIVESAACAALIGESS